MPPICSAGATRHCLHLTQPNGRMSVELKSLAGSNSVGRLNADSVAQQTSAPTSLFMLASSLQQSERFSFVSAEEALAARLSIHTTQKIGNHRRLL